MKFVHIGDIHLGKVIHQYSLIDIQKELLFNILDYMKQEHIQVLVIAGDVYDRLIPSQEAVNVLDEFLHKALIDNHITVLMISGNHDSSDRLHFASSILHQSGLYIETYLKKEMAYITIDDVRFYMLPFIKPSHVKALYKVDDIHDYQEALSYYMNQQTIDKNYKNILITHQFVGHSSLTSESEVPLSVGGSEIIDAHLFDAFDYVALGHLHAPQKVSRETMRYCGSLMRYSFDEVKQNKSFTIVDTQTMSIETIPLIPSRNLNKYKGTFNQFMDTDFIDKKDDFLSFELTDETIIPHAIDRLRILYPYLLQITYTHLLNQQVSAKQITNFEKKDQLSLFKTFYEDVKGIALSTKQIEVVQQLLEKSGGDYENH
ncbi:MAG: exonuclease SbcCD subunit D [Erysipelotrichaceae bacterium]|nr:exonuclease SbcCD subunit D [Erysipelotrichaceae bacterium]